MEEITGTEEPMIGKFCPCIKEVSDACYCTKPGYQYEEDMLYYCCNYFELCEIFKGKYY